MSGFSQRCGRDDTTHRFTTVQRGLHWAMAAAILATLFIGVFMVTVSGPSYLALLSVHRSLGVTILVLTTVRLVLRLGRGVPSPPHDWPAGLRFAATLSHWALYALMLSMPLLGWAMLSAAAYPIHVFGRLTLPPIIPFEPDLYPVLLNAHHLLGLAFFALILLHVSGALFHALVRRDGVLRRMATGRPHRRSTSL